MKGYGIISLIPVICVILFAYKTRRTLESLLIGSILGYIIVAKTGFVDAWINSAYKVLGDQSIEWTLIITALFGSFIVLLEKSGGLNGFAKYAFKYVNSKKKSLILSWIFGIVIFLDDYLHNLTVGTSMRKITDKYNVPRALLAFEVNATAAPICVIAPISTWAVFYGGLLSAQKVTVNGSGVAAYIKCIPYMFYGWVAPILALLVALGIIPLFGSMKRYNKVTEETGDVFSGSTPAAKGYDEEKTENNTDGKLYNFIIPILVLIIVAIVRDKDVLSGALAGIVTAMVMYLYQKLMTFGEFMDSIFKGFSNMSYVIALIIVAFIFKNANDALGLADFVINTTKPFMVGAFLPVVVFIVCCLYAYFTGCFWDMAAVIVPIAIPLAQAVGANIFLVAAAIFSASAFGSQTCMYSDAIIMNSISTELAPVDHSVTSFPFALLSALIAALLFLAAGLLGF